ncbi:MAG: response regulator transcription factor [Spirochaetaceae bacterium]|nr:response regulator transcription factor [Spirochaetaceae bacterium]
MIYCVEDDSSIRSLLVYTLQNTGFEAKGFETGQKLFTELKEKKNECSLILLDIMLPDEDGISILRRLKQDSHFSSIPVIMLTAKSAEYDKVIGLDNGADDYIPKPFGMMELVARIKAVLRRSGRDQTKGKRLYNGPVIMDVASYTLTVKEQSVELTRKEFELLRLFMENTDMVFTRDTILERIWGYDFDGETRTVDVHVRTLRQKLGEKCPACESYIETVRGIGYRMTTHQDII